MNYILGITLSIITSILFSISLLQKEKENMLKYQLIETGINVLKNLFLGGFSGALVQLLGLIRNYIGYKGIKNNLIYLIIILGQFCLGLYFNNKGLIGGFSIIASISYTITIMKTSNIIYLKIALIFNLLLWTIYQIILKDYPAILSNLVLISINVYSLIKDIKGKNNAI